MIKIVIIFCMVVSAGFAGYLPVINPSLHENQNMLSIGNCFAGGIFLIVGVAGLLPDAQKSFDEDLGGSMPLGFVLAVMGYIIIFFIENILFGHTHDDTPPLEDEYLINSDHDEPTKKDHKADNALVSGIILTAALVVHSTFEGIAAGLLQDKTKTITLCVGVLIHNIPAAIALGIKMQGVKKWVYCVLMGAFVLSSPVSIMIGIFLSDLGYPAIQGIFLSISAGTFIYIGCTEILPEEMQKPGRKYSKFLAFILGSVPLGVATLFLAE